MRFLIRWGVNAVALWAAVAILPAVDYRGDWVGLLLLALIFGIVNALFRPILKFLTCPLILVTLGLFTLVINTALLIFTNWLGGMIGYSLIIAEPVFWNALLASLIISAVSVILSLILKDELEGRRPRRRR